MAEYFEDFNKQELYDYCRREALYGDGFAYEPPRPGFGALIRERQRLATLPPLYKQLSLPFEDAPEGDASANPGQ